MPEESTRNTGQALKREREIRGWSRKYVADSIGSDPQSVGRWERGETFPNPYYRQRLCELFAKDARALGLLPDGTSGLNEQGEPTSAYTQQFRTERQGEAVESEKEQYLNGQARPIASTSHLHIASQRLPISIVITTLAIVIIALILSFWRWQVNSFVPSPPGSPTQTVILPGGIWVSPLDGQSYRGIIHFAARAYPHSVSDPPISYVNFTANWEDGWRIVCTVRAPVVSDLYSCNINLGRYGAPKGPIRISFDVYDQAGNVHFAPNGVHTILYTP